MVSQEKWTQWKPYEWLTKKYDILSICDDHNGLTLLLENKEHTQKIKLYLNHWIAAYRYADETYLNKKVSYLFKEYGSQFLCEWSLFKVSNSEYLHYISKTSGGISDALTPLIHIAIFTTEEIFEILTPAEPKIEIIEE